MYEEKEMKVDATIQIDIKNGNNQATYMKLCHFLNQLCREDETIQYKTTNIIYKQ